MKKPTLEDLHERILLIENLLAQTGVDRASVSRAPDQSSRLKQNLKLHMTVKGARLTDLARASGVSKQTISDWQTGMIPRAIINLKRVADSLGVTVDQLVFGGGN